MTVTQNSWVFERTFFHSQICTWMYSHLKNKKYVPWKTHDLKNVRPKYFLQKNMMHFSNQIANANDKYLRSIRLVGFDWIPLLKDLKIIIINISWSVCFIALPNTKFNQISRACSKLTFKTFIYFEQCSLST